MRPAHVRGLIAPVFIALGLVAATLDLVRPSSDFTWLALLSLFLALVFARDTGRLLADRFKH